MICKICFETASDTRVTRCGHVFCDQCISRWFARSETTCPVCRKPLQDGDLIVVYDEGADHNGQGLGKKRVDQGALSGKSVSTFLNEVASKFQSLEKENRVLNLKVKKLEAEVDFLKSLRARRGGGTRGGKGKELVDKDDSNVKENHDPRVETALKVNFVKELKPEKSHGIHEGPVHGISVSRDGRFVASASWDTTCKVYDLELKRECASLQHEHGLYAVRYSPSVDNVVACAVDDCVVLWSLLNQGSRLRCLQEHKREVNGIAFSDNGRKLASASADMTCISWDLETGKQLCHLFGHESEVYGVCYVRNSESLLASCSFDATARIFDEVSGREVLKLDGHKDNVIGIDVHPRNDYLLATGSDDKTCRIWDTRMGKELARMHHHSGEVKRVSFSSSGNFLATTSGDKTIRIYNTASLHCLAVLMGHADWVFDVSWGPTDDFLVSASHDMTWNFYRPNLSERK